MNFNPKAEEDCRKPFEPIPKGEYSFEVLDSQDKVSSKGNDMIEVLLGIWNSEKIICRIFDYLLPSMEAKLRHACDACGLLDKYQQGSLSASDFMGRSGTVKIRIKAATQQYPAKNEVEDYVCRPAKQLGQQHDGPPPLTDDDCPF